MVWRLNVILRHLRRLGLEQNIDVRGFDIGCGHGALQRQLHSANSWRIDGCARGRWPGRQQLAGAENTLSPGDLGIIVNSRLLEGKAPDAKYG